MEEVRTQRYKQLVACVHSSKSVRHGREITYSEQLAQVAWDLLGFHTESPVSEELPRFWENWDNWLPYHIQPLPLLRGPQGELGLNAAQVQKHKASSRRQSHSKSVSKPCAGLSGEGWGSTASGFKG